jgi:hypothetical protein
MVHKWIMLFFLFLSAIIAVYSIGSDHVDLEVYIESGCPVSQAWLLGELTDVFSLTDIVAIIDFKYVPFGSSFFNTTSLSYQCYDDIECETDSIQLCSMYEYEYQKIRSDRDSMMKIIMTGVNSYDCFPFISCMESNSGKINSYLFFLISNHCCFLYLLGLSSSAESCWNSSMYFPGKSTTPWSEIKGCSDEQFKEIMTAGSIATPKELSTVPWILVDGVRYNTTGEVSLLTTICNAYNGSSVPSSCMSSTKK